MKGGRGRKGRRDGKGRWRDGYGIEIGIEMEMGCWKVTCTIRKILEGLNEGSWN